MNGSQTRSSMLRETQFIDAAVKVSCPDAAVLKALLPYFNPAEHHLAARSVVSLNIGWEGGNYLLPAGRSEVSPEVAARIAWAHLSRQLDDCLSSWLQISGICVDDGDRRLLVIGESMAVLRLLAMHCLGSDLDVPSAAGVCLKDGMAVPYALSILLSQPDVARLRAKAGLTFSTELSYDESGNKRYWVTPLAFGRQWIVKDRPLSAIAVLTWNPGGWSGLRTYARGDLLETVINSCHLPNTVERTARLRLIQSAKSTAATLPAIELRLGRLEDGPPLLTRYLRNQTGA